MSRCLSTCMGLVQHQLQNSSLAIGDVSRSQRLDFCHYATVLVSFVFSLHLSLAFCPRRCASALACEHHLRYDDIVVEGKKEKRMLLDLGRRFSQSTSDGRGVNTV